MATIQDVIESERGCGYRVKGGMYLVSGGISAPCYKLPLKLEVCIHCGSGLKFSRGWTWIQSSLFTQAPCSPDFVERQLAGIPSIRTELPPPDCGTCPLNLPKQRMGLLWVGEKFYKTPDVFTREAVSRGVSKRINMIPHGFQVGKTWIALAHKKAYREISDGGQVSYAPGIFHAFKPSRIEYVVTGEESEEELEKLEKRGFTLVNVIRDVDTQLSMNA